MAEPALKNPVTEWPNPRCCRTHTLDFRSRGHGPPLDASEAEELAQLHAASYGDSWLVLVGGEHGGIMRDSADGSRPGPYLAGHCSLHWMGITYDRLVKFFGRSRTIVVAQLAETLDWLRAAAADEHSAARMTGRPSLLPMLRQKLADAEEVCAGLLADGGADYDGPEVNCATVLRVLRGESSENGARVVPQRGVRSVVLVMVSHGHAHRATPSARHHEWYMHFPHPVGAEDDHLYDVVSHTGFDNVDPHPKWDWGAPKRRWKLYSQMLFQAHHEVLQRAPRRRLVLFHQFCLSGGAAEFMRKNVYHTYFGTHLWPVLAITTAGRFEPALGNFVDLWTQELNTALSGGGDRPLGEVYATAQERYWDANPGLRSQNAKIAEEKAKGTAGEDSGDEESAMTLGTVGSESWLRWN